ncbi:flagellar protein FlgN [Rhodoblastus acidophilus]|uniref:Flagellar protein FlgN n=1 Tax=Candidatus Rhodoblastus alkanivorans TaxID=2954117 RepID=A0ABS9Z3Z7_9HYPH|nr:flagellar protein FlgN [Candidatus Rhodoblastus alkanivorans]MCI4678802.1 flagellar protein FlgN [Candidatus Rhodoblastus alkanivorans]MCI4682191.1 flagellar protein FlgN [Candidatus Rhodoblastus alkanivorans]MDI4639493.1 flagellar protein FlgN [Rhodoblastus acidophilus]
MTIHRNLRFAANAAPALYDALDRMEAAIEQETAILRENGATELTDFNHRKRQGLLEINRILRNFDAADLAGVDRTRVLRLVGKLEENQRMLAHHLKAVDSIAALLTRAMQDAESDGTYGRGGAP